jgi:hypothetical protein
MNYLCKSKFVSVMNKHQNRLGVKVKISLCLSNLTICHEVV